MSNRNNHVFEEESCHLSPSPVNIHENDSMKTDVDQQRQSQTLDPGVETGLIGARLTPATGVFHQQEHDQGEDDLTSKQFSVVHSQGEVRVFVGFELFQQRSPGDEAEVDGVHNDQNKASFIEETQL